MFKAGDIIEIQAGSNRYRALVVTSSRPDGACRAEIIAASASTPGGLGVYVRGFKIGNIIHISASWANKWKLLA